MSHKSAPPTVSTIGIDLGKNSLHLIGLVPPTVLARADEVIE